jgi:hypothetical protein
MLKEDLAKFNYDLREGSLVAVAAKIYGCGVSDLLSWAEKDDGSVVIIAPTGQKFTYSADEIMKKILEPTDLTCAGTGAVVYTGDEKLVTGIRDPGADRVAKGKMVTIDPEPGASDVTKTGEVVTPIAGDSQTPDPGAGHDTKAEEVVSEVANGAAAPVTSLSQGESDPPPKRRSSRRRAKKAESDK